MKKVMERHGIFVGKFCMNPDEFPNINNIFRLFNGNVTCHGQ